MADTTGYPELDSLLPRVAALASLDQADLEREEIALVGRKAGEITAALKTLATRPPDERRAFGAAVNALKLRAEAAIATLSLSGAVPAILARRLRERAPEWGAPK